MHPGRAIVIVGVLFVCALCPIAAARGDDPVGVAASMVPRDVDTFVLVHDGAGLRRDLSGRTLDALLKLGSARPVLGDGTEESMIERWESFGRRLGLESDKAFDVLLGSNVYFVSRGWGAGRSWALVSEVSKRTSRKLSKLLDAAPRRVVKGLGVLEIEQGSFWLATRPRKIGEEDGWLLLIGPRLQPELFDQLAETLGRARADSLASDRAFVRAAAMSDRAEIVCFSRMNARNDWLVLTAEHDGRVVRGRVLARVSDINDGRPVPVWSRLAFDRIADGALLAVAGWDLGDPIDRWTSLPVRAQRSLIEGEPAAEAVIGPRYIGVVQPGEEQPFAMASAVETTDVPRLAKVTDDVIARLLARVGPEQEVEPEALDYGGLAPTAMRSHGVPGLATPALAGLLTENPRLSWRHVEGGSLNGQEGSGWWLVGLDEGAVAELARAIENAPVAGRGPGTQAWISLGSMVPSEVVLRLRETAPQLVPMEFGELFAGVGLLRWSLNMPDEGHVLGEFEVRLADE